MFREVPAVPDFPELEKQTIEYWKTIDLVNALKKLRDGSPEKVYYDGPITTNGMPHYGHAITWTLKDIVPRYWSMKGFQVYKNMGWDTKGILVEYEVEKELKFTKKEDIINYGVAKFIQYCRDFVKRFTSVILDYENRLGRLYDPAHIYSTANNDYVESIWWSLKRLYETGLLYEGHKTVAYSTRAGMTLSTHEVSEGGYSEIEDPYVTVKFKVKDTPNTYFLAWTTTPWTIPGNLMLAVNEKLTYVKVESNGSVYIAAKDRVEDLFKDKNYKITEEFKGADLEGMEYEQPYKLFDVKRTEGCFRVILSSHANAEDGTGIVHLAPYGEEDYEIFMRLGIPLFDYLDETAHFTDLVPQYKGLFYKDANPKIIEDLKSMGVLFDFGTTVHRMPMCYRTGTPLIYKPVKSWYVAVSKIKERMLEENDRINWLPEHLKEGNSGIWIKNARDWAISRSRFWGTPLPVWVNDKTGKKIVIGSFAELKEESGINVEDPHRPYVDEITWEDTKTGGTFRRVEDVIDVWYDSGVMPFARWHYPFENEETFNNSMPADYISEGPDQVRLWFYVMHVLGVALFNQAPYKNVVTIGTMLDETGKKMSKSKRNYKPMDEVLNEFGADILRFFIVTSNIVNGQDAIFTASKLLDARKDFFLPLWNSLKYFLTYANIHGFKPGLEKPQSGNILDKWILARLQETINTMTEGMDHYRIQEATKSLTPFITDLSTWYIRRSRDRIKEGDVDALSTLYYVLSQLNKLAAPFVPFTSETLYEHLGIRKLSGLASVHMEMYPKTQDLTAEQTLILEFMKHTRGIVSAALSIRVEEKIKVRQPLETLWVEKHHHEEKYKITGFYDELIKDEVNVKNVKEGTPSKDEDGKYKYAEVNYYPVWLDIVVSEDLKTEGAARELIRQLQDARKSKNLLVTDRVEAYYAETEENKKAVQKFADEIKQKVLAVSLNPAARFDVKKVE